MDWGAVGAVSEAVGALAAGGALVYTAKTIRLQEDDNRRQQASRVVTDSSHVRYDRSDQERPFIRVWTRRNFSDLPISGVHFRVPKEWTLVGDISDVIAGDVSPGDSAEIEVREPSGMSGIEALVFFFDASGRWWARSNKGPLRAIRIKSKSPLKIWLDQGGEP